MSGLLYQALRIRDQLFDQAELNEIPESERDRILEEIDQTIASGKMEINDDSFSFHSVKNDRKLPLFINLTAIILTTLFSLIFIFNLNRQESQIVNESGFLNSTENRLIESLKAESEEQLSAKEEEIRLIQTSLERIRLDRDKLAADSRKLLEEKERELRDQLEKELESEKARLGQSGISTEELNDRMREFEESRLEELNSQMEILLREAEEERLVSERELEDRIRVTEANLESAREEKVAMEESLANERDSAAAKFEKLKREREAEELYLTRLQQAYSRIRDSVNSNDEQALFINLADLERLIEEEAPQTLAGYSQRLELDRYFIESLRNSSDTVAISETVVVKEPEFWQAYREEMKKAEGLYNREEWESAELSYLQAISQIPDLYQSYTRMQSIKERAKESKKNIFLSVVDEGNRLFRNKEYDGALAAYGQAMAYLDIDDQRADSFYSTLSTVLDSQEKYKPELISTYEKQLQAYEILYGILEELEVQIGSRNSVSTGNSEELISLVSTKLKIKEILSSDTIRDKYPDLNDQLDEYLLLYGTDKVISGRIAALQAVVSLTTDLSEDDYGGIYNEEERTLVLSFLNNLKSMINSPQ